MKNRTNVLWGGGGCEHYNNAIPQNNRLNTEKTGNLHEKNAKNKKISSKSNKSQIKLDQDQTSKKVIHADYSANNDYNSNVNCISKEKRQVKGIMVLSFVVLFLSFVMVMFGTYALLQDSKSATGTIAFNFKSPAIDFDSDIELFYTNIDNKGKLIDGALYYGDATNIGLTNPTTFNVNLSENNVLSAYYVKLDYNFNDLDANFVSFDNTPYSFGTTSIGTMTKNVTANNKFTLASGTNKVSTGPANKFNLLSPLSKINAEQAIDTSTSPKTFNVVVSADSKQDFTDSQAYVAINGKIGFRIEETQINSLNDLSGLIVTSNYMDGEVYGNTTNMSNIQLNLTNIPQYLKLTLQSTTPIYAVGTQTATKNGWNYSITTTSSGTTITAINPSSINGFDIVEVLANAPQGAYSSDMGNTVFALNIEYSTNGTIYKSVKILGSQTSATATVNYNVVTTIIDPVTLGGKISNGFWFKWYNTPWVYSFSNDATGDSLITMNASGTLRIEVKLYVLDRRENKAMIVYDKIDVTRGGQTVQVNTNAKIFDKDGAESTELMLFYPTVKFDIHLQAGDVFDFANLFGSGGYCKSGAPEQGKSTISIYFSINNSAGEITIAENIEGTQYADYGGYW